jgi:nucleoside-diphosphate-sugar epimerase
MNTLSANISRDFDPSVWIIGTDSQILVTGAGGFIGTRVVRTLLNCGFKRIRCFVRPSGNLSSLQSTAATFKAVELDFVQGNLLSREDCTRAAAGVSVIYHLAAGTEKTFAGCFLNSVVTARNLLDAVIKEQTLKRFVSISSLAVYSNEKIRRGGLMDESCEIDSKLVERHDPYAYGKAKQDDIVHEYAQTKGLPYVLVRPGVVFGPGKAKIAGRVGIDTFGVFLHLGLSNRMPFTYVDNCAEAIVLAGLRKGIEGEVFNIVDDNLPKSRDFIRMYKKHVGRFMSIPIPYSAFYLFSYLWEKYSEWSEGQLPPAFNRRMCASYFKGNTYANEKARTVLGWHPRVPMSEGLKSFFAYAKEVEGLR